jgi:hypothetical protein
MKKFLLVIFLAILSFSINAQDSEENTEEDFNSNLSEELFEEDNGDKTGIILSLSAFNYFSIGLGFNKGDWWRAGPHFAGSNYGILIEYKTLKEMHLRIYGNMYGGASAMYLGLSGIMCTNFKEITAGISPEIGLGFPGFSLFYRYNIYFSRNYNCHEIVMLIYPLDKILNRKR